MGAKYLSYVKFIATEAPTFFGYIISVLASVDRVQFDVICYENMFFACLVQHVSYLHIWNMSTFFTKKIGSNWRKCLLEVWNK